MNDFMTRRAAQLEAEAKAVELYRNSDENFWNTMDEVNAIMAEMDHDISEEQKRQDNFSRMLARSKGFSEFEIERFVRACRHPKKEWSPEAQKMLKDKERLTHS